MTENKIKQLCESIRHEDFDNLSYGSVRTLKMIEDESESLLNMICALKNTVDRINETLMKQIEKP